MKLNKDYINTRNQTKLLLVFCLIVGEGEALFAFLSCTSVYYKTFACIIAITFPIAVTLTYKNWFKQLG